MKSRRWLSYFLIGLLGASFWAPSASGCPVCYGDTGDPEVLKGMTMGILLLVAVVYGVLFSIIAFFVFIIRRAAILEKGRLAQESAEADSENFTALDHVR